MIHSSAGSQTRGPRHHKNLQNMAEIIVLGAVKMWPSNEFEIETPALVSKSKLTYPIDTFNHLNN